MIACIGKPQLTGCGFCRGASNMAAHPDTIRIGSSVRVRDADGEIETYVITSAKDADPRAGKISGESPLGGALLGRRQGESVVIRAPRGSYTVIVESIE